MSECTHDCSTCSSKCGKESFLEPQNEYSNIKKVIGVVSGKGGVGKSMITSMLATLTARKGYKTAILDADITGPSIPKAFGLHQKAQGMDSKTILPVRTQTGIEVMSINLLLDDETEPVVWRGPVLAGAVKQFWTDVAWNDVDYMYVDMPPGTGDVPLTVFQSLPLDGIIIVTTPHDLVQMIVEKAVSMANMLNIPVIGFVENMSYLSCPKCSEKISVFGESKVEALAQKYDVKNTAKMPIDSALSSLMEKGEIENFKGDYLDCILDAIVK